MWSRILDTELARKAKAQYDADPRLKYHNWQHVMNLYWAAEHVYGLEYDLDLDRAILTHDVIYDEKPLKELRSGRWLLNNCLEDGVEHSFNHIMRTARLEVEDDNRMNLLDLARLMNPHTTILDRSDIYAESIALYGIDHATFVENTAKFFSFILPRFSDENLVHLPQWERQAFVKIRDGMNFSIDIAKNPNAQFPSRT